MLLLSTVPLWSDLALECGARMFNGLVDALNETYTNADVLLRPARVAVLFSGDDNWRAHARFAVASVGNYWGGAGFILVPYRSDGTVDAGILDVVASYDPDHVVALRTTQSDRDRIARGHGSSVQETGSAAAPAQESYLRAPALPRVEAAAKEARKLVVERCTPFRQAFPGDDQQKEAITDIDAEPGARNGWLAPSGRSADSALLAVAEAWESDAALSLSVRTGILPHLKEAERTAEREEPDQRQMMRVVLGEPWPRDLPNDVVESLNIQGRGASQKDAHFWFNEPGAGLSQVHKAFSGEGGAIVIGETADDFALAYAYERLLGFGVWITPKMLTEPGLSMAIRSAVGFAAERIQRSADRLMVTSSSLEDGELTALAAALESETWDTNPFHVADTGTIEKVSQLPGDLAIGRPALEAGLHQLVVEDPVVTSLSVPALVGEDSTLHMRAPLSAPMPAKLLVGQDGQPKPYWYVSVVFSDAAMPRGRGVPQQFVDPDRQRYGNQAVRSSRDGLSYHSQAGGLILAGTTLASQLYRPRLKILGMQPWVQAMVKQVGLDAAPSLPGLHAQLLSRRLGGRTALVSLVSGPYHPALQIFATRKGAGWSTVFPQQDGIVVDDDPYPSFQALCRVLPGLSPHDIRAWVDRLAQAELLWRGFGLNCAECSRLSFVRLGQIGQRYQCSRCLAVNELSAARWRTDTDEPPWFYDLHPAFRELMTTHGDVGLFAAQKLRQGSWEYADTAELEFFLKAGTQTRVAEIDLIAHVDGKVVLVEAKSNTRLGSGRAQSAEAARKKIKIAVALRADRVILATTETHMAASATEHLRSAADAAGAKQLEIQELCGLGPAATA